MKLFDRILLFSMNKREPSMAGRMFGCGMSLVGACIAIYCAVTLPGFRTFFTVAAVIQLLVIAGVIVSNVTRNKW